ncbi:protein canopy 4-like [Plakobranchus ocellatus]|uniref:Protein canopy 4-like n=1 Tax=Plakobranchus ocellatus TaxID=259542 RepID=A0AAV3ZZC4_9GAST|nr:protein canopy 4-like [Plakobranchus ocellatus]
MHKTKHFAQAWLLLFMFVVHFEIIQSDDKGEGGLDDPHRDPSLCEVCKYLATELKGRLDETGKTHDVIETGYGFDEKKKKKEYKKTELRLIEALNDPHVCEKILEYNVHAERKGSLRFAKGRSQTMETLHNLVDKGVNVELGIPYDMWDTPSAGVAEMHRKCFKIVEDFEESIEEWYWNHQEKDLTTYLCANQVLRKDDQECLSEKFGGEKKSKKAKQSERKSTKASSNTETGKSKGDNGQHDHAREKKQEL